MYKLIIVTAEEVLQKHFSIQFESSVPQTFFPMEI